MRYDSWEWEANILKMQKREVERVLDGNGKQDKQLDILLYQENIPLCVYSQFLTFSITWNWIHF